MVDRISNAGSLLKDLGLLQSNRTALDQLQLRLATGKKHEQLKLYGNDAPRIVDLRNQIDSRQAYIRSINLTEGITLSYDAVLDRLAEVASEVVNSATPLAPDDPNFLTDTTVVAENLMLEIEANLNLRIGDRFIFAGTNFTTSPVNDLRNLALYNATDIGVANANETANTVPEFQVDSGGAGTDQSYHTSFTTSPTVDADAWRETALTVNDRQSLSYGITATNPAFQDLIEAVVRMKSAVDPNNGFTRAERNSMLGEARSAAEEAQVSLRQMQSTNGAIINQFERTKAQHENFIAISQNALEGIEGVDTAETAVQISALQTQIQASFTTIARRSQLSLVNFLS
jgi:flagellin-like hook-associated protein FlgL